MSDSKQVQASTDNVSATASGDAASKSDNVAQVSSESSAKKETVSYDTYSRTLSKLKKLEELFESEQRQKEQEKQKALEEQGQWKSVAEAKAKQLEQLQGQLNQTNKMIQDSTKMSAFLKHIPGTVSDEYWALIDLDEIVLDPESQKPDPVALESYAKSWMQKHSRLIDKPATAKAPTEAPKLTNVNQKLSIEDMAKKLAGLKT